LRMIQSEGAKAGVVLNPATPLAAIDEVLELADFVLIMSVNPGFGGQEFIPRTLEKVRRLDRKRKDLGIPLPIEIDGGRQGHGEAIDDAFACLLHLDLAFERKRFCGV